MCNLHKETPANYYTRKYINENVIWLIISFGKQIKSISMNILRRLINKHFTSNKESVIISPEFIRFNSSMIRKLFYTVSSINNSKLKYFYEKHKSIVLHSQESLIKLFRNVRNL